MEEKFKKYWECVSLIFSLATIMDYRIKLFKVKVLLNNISSNLNLDIVIANDINMLYFAH